MCSVYARTCVHDIVFRLLYKFYTLTQNVWWICYGRNHKIRNTAVLFGRCYCYMFTMRLRCTAPRRCYLCSFSFFYTSHRKWNRRAAITITFLYFSYSVSVFGSIGRCVSQHISHSQSVEKSRIKKPKHISCVLEIQQPNTYKN